MLIITSLLCLLYATQISGYNLDFTCFNKYAMVIPNGDQNAFIGGYKGGSDTQGDVSFGRILYTGRGLGLPRGSMVLPHRNPQVFATRLLLPVVGGRDRIGVFYCRSEVEDMDYNITTVIMAKDAIVLPVETFTTTYIREPTTLAVTADESLIPNLRWRHNGVYVPSWDGHKTISLTNTTSRDKGVYECYVEGRRSEARQAIMMLIVTDCPRNKWNLPSCDQDCPWCYNGGICCPQYGTCICPPGFGGEFCQYAFGRNKFGQNGDLQCSGSNRHGNGCRGSYLCLLDPLGCVCAAGFTDVDCTQICSAGYFGSNCRQTCRCANGPAVCLKDTGECESGGCLPGWTGVNCQQCIQGKFGETCESDCHCAHGDSCHFYTGKCNGDCQPGWAGKYCQTYIGLDAFLKNCNTNVAVLSIQSIAINSFTLQWNASTNACPDMIYDVKTYIANLDQCDSVDLIGTHLQNVNVTERLVTVSNLIPYSTYVVYVKAITPEGKVGKEQLVFVTTAEKEPSATPLNIKAASSTHNSLTFDWDLPLCGFRGGAVTSYTYKLTDPGGEVTQSTTDDDVVLIDGLQSSTDYSFVVAASTKAGMGPFSEVLHVTTEACSDGTFGAFCNSTCHCLNQDSCDPKTGKCDKGLCDIQWSGLTCQVFCPVPEAVSNVTSTLDKSTNTSVTVTWNPLSDYPCAGLKYIVEYQLISKDQCETDIEDTRLRLGGETSHSSVTLRGLEFHSTYLVNVKAFFAAGVESFTKMFVHTGESIPSLPPAHITSYSSTSKSLGFTWDQPNCGGRNGVILSYAYKLSNDNETIEGSTEDARVVVGNLNPDSTYRFAVAAVTAIGTGMYSTNVTYNTSQIDCPVGRYGSTCDHTCHCELGYHLCDPKTGSCKSGGCEKQWSGNTCQVFCPGNVTYGDTTNQGSTWKNLGCFTPTACIQALAHQEFEPSKISGLQSTQDKAIGNSMTISWEPITDYPCPGLEYIVEYQLINYDECQLDPDSDMLQLSDPTNQSAVTLSGLEFHSTYVVYIKGSHPAVDGPSSKILMQTGETVPASPPSNIRIYDSTPDSVTFIWEEPECRDRGGEITQYIYHLINKNGTDGGTTKDHVISFKDLQPATMYSFYVAASNSKGRGPFSVATVYNVPPETKVVDTGQISICSDPQDIPGNVSASSIHPHNITFEWGQPSCLVEHRTQNHMEYSYKLTSIAGGIEVIASGRTADTNLTLDDLQPSSTLVFVVGLVASENASHFAEPIIVSTSPEEPSEPTHLQIVLRTQDSVFIMWDDAETDKNIINEISYHITAMPYNPDFTPGHNRLARAIQISSSETKASNFLLAGLLPSTEYEIQVASRNEAGQLSSAVVLTSFTEAADNKYMPSPDPPILVDGPVTMATSVKVIMSPTDSIYHTHYQLAIQRSDTPIATSESGGLWFKSYNQSQTSYITAEFSRIEPPPPVIVIGDNQTYGGYFNPTLEPGFTYFVYYGLVSRLNKTEAGYSWSSAATVTVLDLNVNRINMKTLQESIVNKSSIGIRSRLVAMHAADNRRWFIIVLCIACALFLILICILGMKIIKIPQQSTEMLPETEMEDMSPPEVRRSTGPRLSTISLVPRRLSEDFRRPSLASLGGLGGRSGEYNVTIPKPALSKLVQEQINEAWMQE